MLSAELAEDMTAASGENTSKKRKIDHNELKEDCHENAPVVQVKKITQMDTGGFCITVSCCYCFKDHEHGPSCNITDEVPHDLGHRCSHCSSIYTAGSHIGYHISTKAWTAAGRKIVGKSKLGK